MRREVIDPWVAKYGVAQGTKFGNLIFTSGITARDYMTGEMVQGDMSHLVRVTLNNIKAIVEAGGSTMDNILRIVCYLHDFQNDFAAWNEVYREFFPRDAPARMTLPASLPPGFRIEVEAIACVPTE